MVLYFNAYYAKQGVSNFYSLFIKPVLSDLVLDRMQNKISGTLFY